MKQNAALQALAAAFALAPAISQARCVELTYVFEGQVLDNSGRPAAGALVGASWLEFGQAAGPAIAVVDSTGRYRLSVRFKPGNDMEWFGDRCTERLGGINMIAYIGEQRSYPTQVTISGLNQKLPTITIDEPAAGTR